VRLKFLCKLILEYGNRSGDEPSKNE